MSKQQYLEMCQAMGDEPREDKMPADLEDFPSYVHDGMHLYSLLPNNYVAGSSAIIYTGKDITALPALVSMLEIKSDISYVLDIVKLMEEDDRTKSIKAAEKAAKKHKPK